MTMRRTVRVRSERGISLVETLVMIIITSVTLMSLAAAMGYAYRNLSHSHMDMNAYAATQMQLESLVSVHYDSIASGSSTINGYSLSWTVSGTDPKTLLLDLYYTNRSGYAATERSVLYYPNPN
jgi:Tfp pilus assembly protein PilV